MAEQTFKSPGFFEREIEIISRPIVKNNAVPAGIVGTAVKGPAFVPTTVYSFEEFERIFGTPDRNRLAGHAASEFFRPENSGKAVTFCRVLGSGIKDGTVKNAGFKATSTAGTGGESRNLTTKFEGAMHFLVANHTVSNAEHIGYGQLSDNDSITLVMDNDPTNGITNNDPKAQLVRAMIIPHKDYTVKISDAGASAYTNDVATCDSNSSFNIKFESAASDEGEFSVSLDPNASNYITKVLNTDPLKLNDKKHFVYAHFPIDTAVAEVDGGKVAILHGKDTAYQGHYGDFSSPYTTPRTPTIISQPFGNKEYDLFHLESLDDGEYSNFKYKVSISNLTAEFDDPNNKFGTFNVLLRDLRDTDESPIIYESFNRCSLNPEADNFIAKVIGDIKVKLITDVESDDEKRLVLEGSYKNQSTRVRVVVSDDVLQREVPDEALPFGFKGLPALKTTTDNVDGNNSNESLLDAIDITGEIAHSNDPQTANAGNINKLAFAVLPPLPFRFKVTKGDIRNNDKTTYGQTYLGKASDSESVSNSLYWGALTTRVEDINKVNDAEQKYFNEIFVNYTKLLSASSDVSITGADADTFNNNKFSLSKVVLSLGSGATASATSVSSISGSLNDVFKDAVYIRNADANSSLYQPASQTILMSATEDPFAEEGVNSSNKLYRPTLNKLLSENPKKFNKYNEMMKFTTVFYGGFDGVNITDSDEYYLTDRAASVDANGHADSNGFISALKGTNAASPDQGINESNNAVVSYRNAVRIMTDGMVVNHNIFVIPGIRDSIVTDFAITKLSDYGKSIYLIDAPHYDAGGSRLFVSASGVVTSDADSSVISMPDAEMTASEFDTRSLNSSYVATYFPDVRIEDKGDDDDAAENSRRSIRVPSSVAALGALARTDSGIGLWFAPAGFDRGSLRRVTSTEVRLNAEDRDTLYEARMNPIANFPNNQFVIFGQKTTQLSKTALDRVNVRRLVLEIKRRVEVISQKLLFAQNNSVTRSKFTTDVSGVLSDIKLRQGIEDFRVIMDDSNNTSEDVDNNRLNGRIIFVPTRAIEFIAIDFIVTNAGVEFPS